MRFVVSLILCPSRRAARTSRGRTEPAELSGAGLAARVSSVRSAAQIRTILGKSTYLACKMQDKGRFAAAVLRVAYLLVPMPSLSPAAC